MRQRPALGMTLVEVLVSLVVLAVISSLGLRAIDAISVNREGLLRFAASERKQLLVMTQLRKDLQQSARGSGMSLEASFAIRDDTLFLPGAIWHWGTDGLRRQDPRTQSVTQYMTEPAVLRFSMHSQDSLLAERMVDNQRTSLREMIAIEVSLYAGTLTQSSGSAGYRQLVDMRQVGL